MNANICKFSSAAGGDQELFAFQFIYETQPGRLGKNRSYAAFCCHLVTSGEAVFHTEAGSWPLKRGDLFFAFPSLSFTLEGEGLEYLYISFVGGRPSDLLESMGVTRENPVRAGYGELIDIWFEALNRCGPDNLDLMAKSMLYYTFGLFRLRADRPQDSASPIDGAVGSVREAVEQRYADAGLSLDELCRRMGYSTKYISRRFRELVGVSFSDYLTSCRIRHACVLLGSSAMSIREVAASVGYPDALYFSKVFRKIMKTSPSGYRAENPENPA